MQRSSPKLATQPSVLRAIACRAILAVFLPNAGARVDSRPGPASIHGNSPWIVLGCCVARGARALGTAAAHLTSITVVALCVLLSHRESEDCAQRPGSAAECTHCRGHHPTHPTRDQPSRFHLGRSSLPVRGDASPARRLLLHPSELGAVSLVLECDSSCTEQCPICLELAQGTVRVLPCSHRFHAQCIDPWLTARCTLCPLCKADVVGS